MFKKSVLLSSMAIALAAAAFVYIIIISSDHTGAVSAVAAPVSTPKLIIDAGHGGIDGGAVSANGTRESEINLEIALKLDQIIGFLGQSSIMTRTSEDIDYSDGANTVREKKVEDQKNRVALINGTDNACLISIHQNQYTSGGPFGAEALYAPTEHSKEMAECMQALLKQNIDPTSRRVATRIPASIYLMNNIHCPAVMVECGFLSNTKEEALLRTRDYQLKLAAVIAAGYFMSTNGDTGGTNES